MNQKSPDQIGLLPMRRAKTAAISSIFLHSWNNSIPCILKAVTQAAFSPDFYKRTSPQIGFYKDAPNASNYYTLNFTLTCFLKFIKDRCFDLNNCICTCIRDH